MTRKNETIAPGYVPALRWKKGEISAVKRFFKSSPDAPVTTLALVDNVRERKQNEERSKASRIPADPKKYIDHMADELQMAFNSRKAFVDTSLFDLERSGIDGLVEFFNNGIAKVSTLVPVLRLKDAGARIAAFKGMKPKGIALRLAESELRSKSAISAFLKAIHLGEGEVDLIADLELLEAERHDIDSIADLVQGLVERDVPWRSITLLSGAYPTKPAFRDDGWISCSRHDWAMFASVAQALQARKLQVPMFGDYGIVSPKAKPTSGSGGGGGARPIIRYCDKTYWRMRRAREVTRKGAVSPYFELARECAVDSGFMGRDFSFGDQYIDDRAMGQVSKGGNPSNYITVDTNHHLGFVAAQACGILPKPDPRMLSEFPENETFSEGSDFDQYWET
jgi:Beta protein